MRVLGALLACLLLFAAPAAAAPDLPTLSSEVEGLRHLTFREAVRSRTMSLDEAAAYVRRLLAEELARTPSVPAREAFLEVLGLIPPDSSLEVLLGNLYAEQIRGLYDPHQKVFLVVHGAPADPAVEAALPALGLDLETLYTLHELAHALQDQHFHLQDLDDSTGGSFDRSLALQSLVEGDANLVMFAGAASRLGADPETALAALGRGGLRLPGLDGLSGFGGAPRFLREVATIPYFQGLQFVAAVRDAGGWKAVDGIFGRLPASSEQVLHPEKYLEGGDPPRAVRLAGMPRAFGPWKVLGEDTAGEFTIQIWGDEFVGGEGGREAAAGWGGDTYRVYSRGKQAFVVWASVWDTERDAGEFESLARGAGGGMAGMPLRVERRGDRVLVLLGVPDDVSDAVGREAWNTTWEP